MQEEMLLIAKAALVLLLSLGVGVPVTMLCERRLGARLQRRFGPRDAGPRGVLQPFADLIKLMGRQQVRSGRRAEALWAPIGALLTSLLLFATIPFGEGFSLAGQVYAGHVADIGLIGVLGVLAAFLFWPLCGAYSTGDHRALLSGVGYVSRQLAYLLCIGLSVAGVLLSSASVSLAEITLAQTRAWGGWPLWNIGLQPLGCAVFMVAGLTWAGRPPIEADAGLAGIEGAYYSGYGGGSLALWQIADHARLLAIACLTVALYGGGWHWPGLAEPGSGPLANDLVKAGIFAAKTLLALWILLWMRWSLPEVGLRRRQRLAWKVLLPMSLVNLGVTVCVIALL
ncbi:MAG TPA: NADH-quinone oxidoreductase subunit H [Candidatus Latescibacteria bacterium]|nr:NADH-quinone oxidoreductase subunit H [Candidatus Latescibacterota bacterium]